ncbi:hypothetical protein CBS101457_001295 [Exobasidium rhododendri]|nr:hypothetical protein CBS101457_001295 [Exobasidium rhododendri]
MALSIFVPIGYITVLIVSLSIFSKIYRKRTAMALAMDHGNPWFPEGHPERDIYQTLVQAAASSLSADGTTAAIPDVVLKAALLNRAMTDVKRIIRMRDDKQALNVLLQKGSIGDETMSRFSMAEKELEAEILDVVSEANTFKEGWGQLIFPSASEMVAHLKHKEVYYDIHRQRIEETKKLVEAGRPVPQPSIELPPLITPAGTSITLGPGPSPAIASASVSVPPVTNGTATSNGQVHSSSSTGEVGDDEENGGAEDDEAGEGAENTNNETGTPNRAARRRKKKGNKK